MWLGVIFRILYWVGGTKCAGGVCGVEYVEKYVVKHKKVYAIVVQSIAIGGWGGWRKKMR